MISIKLKRQLASASGTMILDVDFDIEEAEFLCIYGESGAGKSSLLRMISGLMKPDEGEIITANQDWYNSQRNFILKPQKRNVGLVFQEYNLFPNLSVKENLLFGTKDKSVVDLNYILDVLQLGDLLGKKPSRLSGGQKQRVALGRAVLQKPNLLLLDEPLSALDYKLRSDLQDYLAQIHKDLNLTTVLVSHDISEIFKLCTRVIHLKEGKIIRDCVPAELFTSSTKSKQFQLTGEVLHIESHEIFDILTVLIGTQIVDVVHANIKSDEFKIGEKVLVSTMAFNPVIQKLK